MHNTKPIRRALLDYAYDTNYFPSNNLRIKSWNKVMTLGKKRKSHLQHNILPEDINDSKTMKKLFQPMSEIIEVEENEDVPFWRTRGKRFNKAIKKPMIPYYNELTTSNKFQNFLTELLNMKPIKEKKFLTKNILDLDKHWIPRGRRMANKNTEWNNKKNFWIPRG